MYARPWRAFDQLRRYFPVRLPQPSLTAHCRLGGYACEETYGVQNTSWPCYVARYGSCLENKKLGVGFKFLSYRVFEGFLGGTEGGTSRFAVGGRRD